MNPNSLKELSMTSFVYDIGEKERAGSRFIAHVRSEVQDAFLEERNFER